MAVQWGVFVFEFPSLCAGAASRGATDATGTVLRIFSRRSTNELGKLAPRDKHTFALTVELQSSFVVCPKRVRADTHFDFAFRQPEHFEVRRLVLCFNICASHKSERS